MNGFLSLLLGTCADATTGPRHSPTIPSSHLDIKHINRSLILARESVANGLVV